MSNFKTMLAGKADMSKLQFPVLGSPKLDGVRVHIIDGVAVSRNLKPFRNANIQDMFGRREFNGLDGEFMVGDPTHAEAFRKTGVLNSYDGDVRKVKMHVFDDFTVSQIPFNLRLMTARSRIKKICQFVLVPHTLLSDAEEVDAYEAVCLAAGYEGIMLRDPIGLYKYGRSTSREGGLLKVKRFEDSEAVIDGAVELMHNANEKTLVANGKAKRNHRKDGLIGRGVLGALLVRDVHTGISFSIGSGFNADERVKYWKDIRHGGLIGKVVKYQYFPTGSKTLPRFPTFKGFRDEIDI